MYGRVCMKIKSVIVIIIGIFLLTGCAGITPNLGSIGKSGNYESKNKIKDFKKISKDLVKNQKDDLLWQLDAGLISKYAYNYNQSVLFFDKAEKKIKAYNKKVLAGKLLSNIGATLTNDTFLDYTPKIYEGIMVNTYKGIDFLSEGKNAYARVEFNRALDRQRRAKAFFAKEIAQEKKKIEKENKKKLKEKNIKGFDLKKATKNSKTTSVIEKRYTNLFAFKPYPDFVNPFTNYVAGIYFYNTHDYRKATELLKETYGMIKGNEKAASYVKNDLKLAIKADKSIRLKKSNKHYAWIFFENGQGATKKEMRIDIPLFLFTSKAYYTGIALPTFKENSEAYSYLIVNNGKKIVRTKEVADMDKIIKTEFKKRFHTIMVRAIARTVTQTVIQYQLRKRGGVIGGLIGSVYQGAMNRADTRQWKLLPKNFHIARVLLKNPTIKIKNPMGKDILKLHLDKRNNYMIFIRIINKSGDIIHNEIKF